MKFAYLIEPPFNYRDAAGTVTGCDVELARHVAAAIGGAVFEPVEAEFAELLPGVAAGRWRMTTGLFATEERCRTAAFSRPIWALSDGLLVRKGNPLRLEGYMSVAAHPGCRLAVIRDQFQHRTAIGFGVPENRVLVFETYTGAAHAVQNGMADAYASVGRAHDGFTLRNPGLDLEWIGVPTAEKEPAFGSFAFAPTDDTFRDQVDEVLESHIGGAEHRAMMKRYGFTDAEVDLLVR